MRTHIPVVVLASLFACDRPSGPEVKAPNFGVARSASSPTLSPANVTLSQAQTQTFTAAGSGPFTWALQGGASGTIASSGSTTALYTAGSPGSAGATDTVTVTDTGASNTTASATVTISKGINSFANYNGSGLVNGNGFQLQNNTRVVQRVGQTFQAQSPCCGDTTGMVTFVQVDMIRTAGGGGQNIKAEIHSLTGSGGIDDQGASNAYSTGSVGATTAIPTLGTKTKVLIPMTPGTALTVGTNYALTIKLDVAGTFVGSVVATDANGGVGWWFSKRYLAGGFVARGVFTSLPADYTKDTAHSVSANIFIGEVYPAPTTSSIAPTSILHGSSGITLTVNGTNFFGSSTVKWAGAARTTTYVSSTKLTAAITTADLVTAGTYAVTVTTPAPGGGTTSAINFSVSAGNGDVISTSAGGDNPPASTLATSWSAGGIGGVVTDTSGNVFYTDGTYSSIFKVDSSGNVHLFAGSSSLGFSGDGGAATAAQLQCSNNGSNFQCTLAVDSSGNVFIVDRRSERVRMVPAATGTNYGQSMTANSIYTVVGGGSQDFAGDAAAATSAGVDPYGVAIDSSGNIYVADRKNHRIRMVPKTTGTYFGQSMTANYIYTIAGTGTNSFSGDSGIATSGTLGSPYGVGVDSSGNVYIADTGNNRIRMVPKTTGTYFGQSMTASNIYTVAGNGATSFAGDGGAATSAAVNDPLGVVADSAGHLYIADYNNRIRMVAKTTGTYFGQSMTANDIYTIAGNGSGSSSGDGAVATSGSLYPYTVAVDSSGNVYAADQNGNKVRMIPAATGTNFGQSMTGSYIYTVAGNGTLGFTGDALAANVGGISGPTGVALDSSDNVYLSDEGNHRIRMVPKTTGTYFGQSMTANSMYTIAGTGAQGFLGDGAAATSAKINGPSALTLDSSGNVYFADYNNHRIRVIAKTTATNFGQSMTANNIYTVAGNGSATFAGDGAAATSGSLNYPVGVVFDSAGNLIIGDDSNNRIRMVAAATATNFGQSMTANYIYTIAGNGTGAFGGDGSAATSGSIQGPHGVAIDSSGNLVIADRYNNRVRMVCKTTGTYFGVSMTANSIYTIIDTGNVNNPKGVTVDSSGNLLVTDTYGHRVRMVPKTTGTYFTISMTANSIYTIAGNGTNAFAGDSGAGTSASLDNPSGLAFDSSGNLYVADYSNGRIRLLQ